MECREMTEEQVIRDSVAGKRNHPGEVTQAEVSAVPRLDQRGNQSPRPEYLDTSIANAYCDRSLDALLRQAQVEELFRQGVPGIVSALVGAVILTMGLWTTVSHFALLTWLGAFSLSLLPRLAIGAAFRKASPEGDAVLPWATKFALGTATGGLFWAALPVFLFPADSPLQQAFITFVLGGLCVGITVANGARREAQIPFILIVSVALVGRFLYEGGREYVIMAVLWSIFTTYLVTAAHRMHLTITESLRLRFEKNQFIEALTAKKIKSDKLNAHLRHEIERRKQLEDSLRRSERNYRDFLQFLPQLVYELDQEGRFTFLNKSALDIGGYTEEDMAKGLNSTDLFVSQGNETILSDLGRLSGRESLAGKEYMFKRKDGTLVPVITHCSPQLEGSEIVGFRGVGMEITERKRMESALRQARDELEVKVQERTHDLLTTNERLKREVAERREAETALRESEENYRIHFENANDVIYSYDSELRILQVSPSVERLLGYAPNELIGHHVFDFNFLPPEELRRALEDARRVLSGERIHSSVYRFTSKDGTARFAEVSGAPLMRAGEIVGVISVARDITERVRAEQALKESEEKYRNILANMQDGYFEVDLKGNMVFFNDAACQIMGYSKDKLLGLNYREYMNAETAQKVFETFNRVYTTGETARLGGWEIIGSDGTPRILETPVTLILDADGNPSGFRGLARDVTQKKNAEEALRKAHEQLEERVAERTLELKSMNERLQKEIEVRKRAEELYRLVVELSPVPIHINCDDTVVFANPSAVTAMQATSQDELIGKCLFDFLDPSLHELAKQRTQWMLDEWKPAPPVVMRGHKLDGTEGWVDIRSVPIMYEGRQSIMVFALDVTEQKMAEDKLRESLREKEILLREIHHRVKNNLQLMASMMALQSSYHPDPAYTAVLKESQMRIWSMARAHETLYRSSNLSEINAKEFLERLGEDLLSAYGDHSSHIDLTVDIEQLYLKIDQALNCGLIMSELISNSIKHAFGEREEGSISIGLHSRKSGEFVFRVKDDGIGLPEHVQIGQSSSFGLDLVSLLLEEMNGTFQINRQNGTEFVMAVPGPSQENEGDSGG